MPVLSIEAGAEVQPLLFLPTYITYAGLGLTWEGTDDVRQVTGINQEIWRHCMHACM